MIGDIDKDGSGSIDFEELLDMMTAKMSDKDTREDIQKVFNLFDDDQTGHISLRNLKRVAKELGETMSGKGAWRNNAPDLISLPHVLNGRCRAHGNDRASRH